MFSTLIQWVFWTAPDIKKANSWKPTWRMWCQRNFLKKKNKTNSSELESIGSQHSDVPIHIFLCLTISFWCCNICANRAMPIHILLSFWCWQEPHLTLAVSAFYCHQRDVSSIIQWWATIGDKEKDDIQRCLIVTLLIMLMLTKKMTSGENKEEKENLSIPVLVCPAHHLVHLHMYFWW